ncbi:hypothetical protein KI387_005240, partial [Taxus chinensis]
MAHFYMDPEVHGVLVASKQEWPHIHISDSLVMANRALKMAEAGCKTIAVLGVDFMSKNVRAILDRTGFEKLAREERGNNMGRVNNIADKVKALTKSQARWRTNPLALIPRRGASDQPWQ